MTDEKLTCGRCKHPYEIDEEHVIFKKGRMVYIRCSFCNQVRRIAWAAVSHLKPDSVGEGKGVTSGHVKPVEQVNELVKPTIQEHKIEPLGESSKKEKISELISDSVPKAPEARDQAHDRKSHEVVKTLFKDTSGSDKGVNPKQEESVLSKHHSDSSDSGNGGAWVLAGLGSLIVVGLGVLLGGRRK